MKRYREPVQVDAVDGAPAAFVWRGERRRVVAVHGRWRDDAPWWTEGSVEAATVTLWRVETDPWGVVELSERAGRWQLERICD